MPSCVAPRVVFCLAPIWACAEGEPPLSLAERYWLLMNEGRDVDLFEPIGREARMPRNRAGKDPEFNKLRAETLDAMAATALSTSLPPACFRMAASEHPLRALMDRNIGRMVEKLEALGIRENTLVLFLGDNGTEVSIRSRMGDFEMAGEKGSLTRAGTNVPMIVNWPDQIDAGLVSHGPVVPADFFATMAEATGARPRRPSGDGKLDGISLLPALTGGPGRVREWALVEYVLENRGKMYLGHEGRHRVFAVVIFSAVANLFCRRFRFTTTQECRQRAKAFFMKMKTPVHSKTEGLNKQDRYQQNLPGSTSLIASGFLCLLLLVPNPISGRLPILFVCALVSTVGVLLRIALGKQIWNTDRSVFRFHHWET